MLVDAKYEGDDTPQSLSWNLLFDSNGSVKPEMAYLLAREHALFLTRDPELVGSGVVTEEDTQIELALIRPGIPVASRVVNAIKDVMTSYLECAENAIGMGPLGYPPLPMAWRDDLDRKCPGDWIPSRYLGHPIFWLPSDVLRPFDGEEEPTYTTRIALELHARGVMNLDTGDVVDVLVSNGLDYRDPEIDEMLSIWRTGEPVPELDDLILPYPEDIDTIKGGKDWAVLLANEIVSELWSEIELAECNDLNGQVIVTTETLENMPLQMAVEPFEEIGRNWFSSERTDDDNAELRESVESFTSVLIGCLSEEWTYLLVLEKMRAEHLFGVDDRKDIVSSLMAELTATIEAAISKLNAETDKLLEKALKSTRGEAEGSLTEIWNVLATTWLKWISGPDSVVHEVTRRWAEAGPIDISEFSIGPAPIVLTEG